MRGKKRCNESWDGKARVPVPEATNSNKRTNGRHAALAKRHLGEFSYNSQPCSQAHYEPNRRICFNSGVLFMAVFSRSRMTAASS
jgi:hypothetical protein